MIFKSRAPLEENIYVDEQRTRMSTRWALWFQDVAKRVSGYFDELYTTKITTDTNDLTINCGTDKTLVLSHVVTDDVYPSSVTVGVGGTAPSFTAYSGNLKAYEFTGGTSNKELIIGWQLNHSYQEASSITPHIHVHFTSGAGDATKTIIFDFEYECGRRQADADALLSTR